MSESYLKAKQIMKDQYEKKQRETKEKLGIVGSNLSMVMPMDAFIEKKRDEDIDKKLQEEEDDELIRLIVK